jgi:hypothetical protein
MTPAKERRYPIQCTAFGPAVFQTAKWAWTGSNLGISSEAEAGGNKKRAKIAPSREWNGWNVI